MKFETMVDGEWCRIPRRTVFIRCCDCGLVHRLVFRVVAGQIRFQACRIRPKTRRKKR